MQITQQRLKEVITYNPDTGIFVWVKGRCAGKIAGSVMKYTGYRHIQIDTRIYHAGRLAWLYIHGNFPVNMIDHINRVRNDDRLINLRPCSRNQNSCNRMRSTNNASGYKGVHFAPGKGKYVAQITKDHQQIYLGAFDTAEEAYSTYCTAGRKMHGEFFHAGD